MEKFLNFVLIIFSLLGKINLYHKKGEEYKLGNLKIVKPRLSKYLTEKNFSKEDSRGDCYDLWIRNCSLEFHMEEVEFNGCKFEKVDFSSAQIRNVDFIDCVFEHCNLSGVDFSNRSIHRCSFEHCNLVGCDFIQSGLQDISITDSKCDYVNFSSSQMKHFSIKDSVFRKGRVVDVQWSDIYFEKINFEETEFLHTKLDGIDFGNCNIDRISVLASDVKGMIVNPEQALMLISLLGINIKD